MKLTTNFINILLNNREKIVEELVRNYSYDYLIKLFDEINEERDDTVRIVPNDRYLYRLLTGNYHDSRYDKSSIDWLPSEELVDGFLALAQHYQIGHIEEIHTGMGILSALLLKKNVSIKITAADTFNSIQTCNKLGLVPIAKRGIAEYQYYPILKEPYPEMLVSTYYPDLGSFGGSRTTINNYLSEISQLLQNGNHKIVVLIFPHTLTKCYNLFYHLVKKLPYTLYSFYVRAFDKYYSLSKMLAEQYPSFMLAHIFIKDSCRDSAIIERILSAAIISGPVDQHCRFAKQLTYMYDKMSPKLIKRMCYSYNFMEPYTNNKKIFHIINQAFVISAIDKINIPQHIYDIDEFIFWTICIHKKLYFHFDSRIKFFQFYSDAIALKILENRKKRNFPWWIRSIESVYKYIYLDIIEYPGEWRKNRSNFDKSFGEVNSIQQQKLLHVS